jgi:hypothetical protein
MAETPPTPATPKSAIKADQYTPAAKLATPKAEKADQTEAAKPGRSTATKTDQPVNRLMTVTITIEADSGEVVRIEGVDATGSRHELTDEEKASLMKERHEERLGALVEQAFEAGIATVLGREDDETTEETQEDAELRRELLAPLLEESGLGQLTERTVLNRAILGTLIEHSMK